jgi:hypothetical protein
MSGAKNSFLNVGMRFVAKKNSNFFHKGEKSFQKFASTWFGGVGDEMRPPISRVEYSFGRPGAIFG